MKNRNKILCTTVLPSLGLCLFLFLFSGQFRKEGKIPAVLGFTEKNPAYHEGFPEDLIWQAPDYTVEYTLVDWDLPSLAKEAEYVVYGEIMGTRRNGTPLQPLASVTETVKVLASHKDGLPAQAEITIHKEDGILSQIGQREFYFLCRSVLSEDSQNTYCPLIGSSGEYLELPDGRFSPVFSLLSASPDHPPDLTGISGAYSYEELLDLCGFKNP